MVLRLGEWQVVYRWPEGELHGGPEELTIRPAERGAYPAGGISQTVLREINFREAAATHRSQVEANRQGRRPTDSKLIAGLKKSAAGGVSDFYLARLSELYVLWADAGLSNPGPIERLADELGRSSKTVQNQLWAAQRKGILTDRTPGRAGGKLTDTARDLLVIGKKKGL